MRIILILLLLLATPLLAQQDHGLPQIAPGIYRPKLVLPAELEARKPAFEAQIEAAHRRLYRFCERYHWEYLLEQPIVLEVRIFATKDGYDDCLRELYPEAKDMKIPKTYTAGFKDDIFFAVSPEVYAQCCPEFVEPDYYVKLLTHEFGHRLHTRLVNGDEEKMGPIWFWEGFATLVAGQFEDNTTVLKPGQLEEILGEPKRGDYRVYNAITKHFVKLVPLPELVRRASLPGFNEWLMENANP